MLSQAVITLLCFRHASLHYDIIQYHRFTVAALYRTLKLPFVPRLRVGYFASMFRHFGNDPESAEVMRWQAPNTYEWLARVWNASADNLPRAIEWQWPETPEW